jgi:hypothetical protein
MKMAKNHRSIVAVREGARVLLACVCGLLLDPGIFLFSASAAECTATWPEGQIITMFVCVGGTSQSPVFPSPGHVYHGWGQAVGHPCGCISTDKGYGSWIGYDHVEAPCSSGYVQLWVFGESVPCSSIDPPPSDTITVNPDPGKPDCPQTFLN